MIEDVGSNQKSFGRKYLMKNDSFTCSSSLAQAVVKPSAKMEQVFITNFWINNQTLQNNIMCTVTSLPTF